MRFQFRSEVRTVSGRLLVAGLLLLGLADRAVAAHAPAPSPAGAPAPQVILPPLRPWHGASLGLVVPPEDPWITPCERSGLTSTPRYDEMTAWLRRLDAAAPQVSMISLGKSPEGRDIWMVIASAEGARTPEALKRNGRPTLLAQAGIHSGEIEGKDAGMMLLRDMTVRGAKRRLLEGANFLFIPIFNVDGHERFSRFNRINQRGPVESGWRTTATNLNLNRDYAKADAPEMKCLLRALNAWDPDLYYDLHVTDGADYQYDITYGFTGPEGYSPAASRWMETVLTPWVNRDLQAMGHIPGPLVFMLDDADPSRGIAAWMAGPRFSNAYGNIRHLPTVLVENHSLKPHGQRVLGTYVLLESTLELLGRHGRELQAATRADRERRPAEVTLRWRHQEGAPDSIDFLGIEARQIPSAVSGGMRLEYTGRPFTRRIPHFRRSVPETTVRRTPAYWIPAAWTEVIDRLALHGVRMERIAREESRTVEVYRLRDIRFETRANEGRVPVSASPSLETRRATFPPGSVRVPTDQPLGELITVLLEPASPESFFRWGFFTSILQETEYVEGYVMEPMAERMLAADPALRAEFEAQVAADTLFARDPRARLHWFFARTPYSDSAWDIYPVARELGAGTR